MPNDDIAVHTGVNDAAAETPFGFGDWRFLVRLDPFGGVDELDGAGGAADAIETPGNRFIVIGSPDDKDGEVLVAQAAQDVWSSILITFQGLSRAPDPVVASLVLDKVAIGESADNVSPFERGSSGGAERFRRISFWGRVDASSPPDAGVVPVPAGAALLPAALGLLGLRACRRA